MNTPKGYVALRNSYDGKTILVDARGLYVAPRPSEGGSKETCCVASVYYDDTGWTIAESFDEVCAKLAAALGEQTPPAAPALHDLERAVVDTGLSWERDPGSLDLTQAHIAAVRALRAARGGA